MMSINNSNHFLTKGPSPNERISPNKYTDKDSKLHKYKHHASVNMQLHDNDVLSSTTDKRTTDDRIESSHRALTKEIRDRKKIQKIEEDLELEYKFYRFKTNAKDQNKEKLPEILLKEAAEKTLRNLAEIAPHYSSVLLKIRDCYNNCIKTVISDFESKDRQIKKFKKEVNTLKIDNIDLSKMNDALKTQNSQLVKDLDDKEKSIAEINKELAKLKKANRETEKEYQKLEAYATDLKLSKQKNLFGKYDQEQVLLEIQHLLKENEDLKSIARELKAEMEYCKKRENKLMYF